MTRLAWMAHKLVSSNRPTRYASLASCNTKINTLMRHDKINHGWYRLKIAHGVNNSCGDAHLQSANGSRLETKISFEVLSNFSHKSLERQFADQQLGGLLVTTNFTKRHCSRAVTMGLLHSTSTRCRFTRGFCSQLFTGSFTSRGLTSSLLGTCHISLKRKFKFKLKTQHNKHRLPMIDHNTSNQVLQNLSNSRSVIFTSISR